MFWKSYFKISFSFSLKGYQLLGDATGGHQTFAQPPGSCKPFTLKNEGHHAAIITEVIPARVALFCFHSHAPLAARVRCVD